MKQSILVAVAALLLGTGFSAHAETKIGTVDMQKIYREYYKSKDALARLEAAKTKAQQEFDDKRDQLQKDAQEIKKLQEEAANPALSKDAKDAKQKAIDEKIAKIKPADREAMEFFRTQQMQLLEQKARMEKGIYDEITKVILEKAKTDQYDLIFDRSSVSARGENIQGAQLAVSNGFPAAVFARDSLDFSDEIIAQLNKNKPKAAATSTTSPAGDKKN